MGDRVRVLTVVPKDCLGDNLAEVELPDGWELHTAVGRQNFVSLVLTPKREEKTC